MSVTTHQYRLWMIAILIALPMIVYGPSVLRNGFVSIDDSLLIIKNVAVHTLTPATVSHVFTSYDPELYIPLTLLSYQIEWAIAGEHPFLFHFTNLLLHIGTGCLLFLFLRRIFSSQIIAFFAALLFVLHPVHTEAVAWAAARKDVLSAFFFVWTLLLYESSGQEGKAHLSKWAILTFLAALLSKVTVALLPLVLILLDWRRPSFRSGQAPDDRASKSWSGELRMTWPYFALSAVFIVIALFGKAKNIESLGLWKTALLSAKAIAFYLVKLLWPFHLSVIYSQQTPVTLQSPEFFVPVILVIALLGAIILIWNRYRNVGFGLLFFVLTLLPNFANFWKNRWLFFASDRYAYIPSIGLVIILCALCVWVLRRNPARERVVIGVLGVLSALFALLTFRQSAVWRSDILLYQNVLQSYPDSALAQNNLGDAYVKAGKPDIALSFFALAGANDPLYIQALTNAGNIERERGNLEKAREWYEKAIGAIGEHPRVDDVAPHYMLGQFLMEMGNVEEGLSHFRAAVELLPSEGEPSLNWGLQLQKLNRGDEAIPLFEKAVSLRADDLASRYSLAALYAERGRLPDAQAQLEYIVSIDPGYEKAAQHLQNIRRLMGE